MILKKSTKKTEKIKNIKIFWTFRLESEKAIKLYYRLEIALGLLLSIFLISFFLIGLIFLIFWIFKISNFFKNPKIAKTVWILTLLCLILLIIADTILIILGDIQRNRIIYLPGTLFHITFASLTPFFILN